MSRKIFLLLNPRAIMFFKRIRIYSDQPNRILIARSVATRQSHEIASLRSQ